jgi:hypothetical protein
MSKFEHLDLSAVTASAHRTQRRLDGFNIFCLVFFGAVLITAFGLFLFYPMMSGSLVLFTFALVPQFVISANGRWLFSRERTWWLAIFYGVCLIGCAAFAWLRWIDLAQVTHWKFEDQTLIPGLLALFFVFGTVQTALTLFSLLQFHFAWRRLLGRGLFDSIKSIRLPGWLSPDRGPIPWATVLTVAAVFLLPVYAGRLIAYTVQYAIWVTERIPIADETTGLFSRQTANFVLGPAMLLLITVTAHWLFSRAGRYLRQWRLKRRDARASLKPGQFVLLLRSFMDDTIALPPKSLFARLQVRKSRLEEVAAQQLGLVGNFVAVGKPNETLPHLGANRVYLNDGEWQQQVLTWVRDCRMIVMVAGLTKWLVWELQSVRSSEGLTKLMILLPPGDNADRQARWTNVCKSLEGSPWYASVLAAEITEIRAVTFKSDGRVRLLTSPSDREIDYELAVLAGLATADQMAVAPR